MKTLLNTARLGCAVAAIGAAMLLAGGAGAADDYKIKLINQTGHPMVRFHASVIGKESWGDNILEGRTIKAGQSGSVNIAADAGACLYDFKAVFEGGGSLIRNRINVCKTGEYRYSDD